MNNQLLKTGKATFLGKVTAGMGHTFRCHGYFNNLYLLIDI